MVGADMRSHGEAVGMLPWLPSEELFIDCDPELDPAPIFEALRMIDLAMLRESESTRGRKREREARLRRSPHSLTATTRPRWLRTRPSPRPSPPGRAELGARGASSGDF